MIRGPTGTIWRDKEAGNFLNSGSQKCRTPQSDLSCAGALAEPDSSSGTTFRADTLLCEAERSDIAHHSRCHDKMARYQRRTNLQNETMHLLVLSSNSKPWRFDYRFLGKRKTLTQRRLRAQKLVSPEPMWAE